MLESDWEDEFKKIMSGGGKCLLWRSLDPTFMRFSVANSKKISTRMMITAT